MTLYAPRQINTKLSPFLILFTKQYAIFVALLSGICLQSYAQRPLTNSRTTSYYTYIYELKPEDVLKFYKYPDQDIKDEILHKPVDSFRTGKYLNDTLAPGNYIQASAEMDHLNYKLIEVHSAFIQLLDNNYDRRFVFLNRLGKPVDDIVVRANGKVVPFDNISKTFHLPHRQKSLIVEADYKGIANFFKITGGDDDNYDHNGSWFGRTFSDLTKLFKNRNRYSYTKTHPYSGFMVFNKPKYRPHDTVKFKAFILNTKSRLPITDEKLLVVFTKSGGHDQRKLGIISKYRNGGFEYSLVLTDSLKLLLDQFYTVELESLDSAKQPEKYGAHNYNLMVNGHTVYAYGGFKYEDYDLKSVSFNARMDKKDFGPGYKPAIYLKATDENGLAVADGRVKLAITTYDASSFKDKHVFVPDTLYKWQVPLDAVGETKVLIPDSIFPRAGVTFEINAQFLNSSNESHEQSITGSFYWDRYNLQNELSGDTLKTGVTDFGKEIQMPALISAININGDTISKTRVILPAKTLINNWAETYSIDADSVADDFEFKDDNPNIVLGGERSADSLFIKVSNPRNIHFWYTIFADNGIIDAGDATQLDLRRPFTGRKIVSLVVNYIWAGKSRKERITDIVYRDDKLNIAVKQPFSIYPGQKVTTDIEVTDAGGKPVANTDITAWSVTRKFINYRVPSAPYLGPTYKRAKTKENYELDEINATGIIPLNWDRWKREMGLDSIVYYQFTHTQTLYRAEEAGIDTVTQIAPFIVFNGEIVPVHLLCIDGQPVYFSQAQQLQPYSFAVSPGKHSLRFRTSHQNIKLDNIDVEKSKKLIIGLNAGFATQVVKVSDTLNNYEARLINKYMITVEDNFGPNKTLLRQNDRIFVFNPSNHQNNSILTGPLADSYTLFEKKGTKPLLFVAEPGYSYRFEPALIRQRSTPGLFPFNTKLSNGMGTEDYRQYVITDAGADSLWQDYLDMRANSEALFVNPAITPGPAGKLYIEEETGKVGKNILVKNIIIYKYDDPDFIRVYPGKTTDFGELNPGRYRVLYLLKGNKYDLKDSIQVKPYGKNYYRVAISPTHLRDAMSAKIDSIISSRPGNYNYGDYEIENDALKLKEAFNDTYFDTKLFGAAMSGTVLGANDKLPVVGASVLIKGTNKGAVTDVNGHFKLNVPNRGKLIIAFIGYVTQEKPIEPGAQINIKLTPASAQLREVVVTGYQTQLKKDMAGSVSTVNEQSMLTGLANGVQIVRGAPGSPSKVYIRGFGNATTTQPLYVVDGEVVSNLNSVDPNDIETLSALKNSGATAIYGIAGGNGVIVITTKKKSAEIQMAAAASRQNQEQSIRKNFSDYGYWQPKLTTDENGKASFTTTFPDDITNWHTVVMAVNGNKQAGSTEGQIKAYKPLSAAFIAPLFAVQGDELSCIGKISNYNPDPAWVQRVFSYNGQILKGDSANIKNAKIDTLNIIANATDSLTFEYTIKRSNGYFDGERRKIPVIEQGVMETKGAFAALDRDTTVTMNFDPALGPVTFRAEASVLPALQEECERLRSYKYLCNEQLASKLEGLLAEKRISTFWGKPFKFDKNIKELIQKLQENRKPQGTWGWWKDTDEELWISLHAIEALTDAEELGYGVEIDRQKLADYLVYQLESYSGQGKLVCLRLLLKLKAKVDYPKYAGLIDQEFRVRRDVSEYEQLSLMLLREQSGLPIKLDSLFATERHTLFGNIYWGEDCYRFFDNSIQVSLLAYRIIKADGKHTELLAKIRGYLLEQRNTGEWCNTYESALILETILPDVLKPNETVKPACITLNGTQTQTITSFPYTTTLNDAQLAVSKTGGLPVYITGYQQFWNKNPEKLSKDFSVNTWFERNGEKLSSLKGGEKVELKAEVNVKGDAGYVMIEVPIPAGCAYESKNQSWANNEVHREYFKEKVCIFCSKLKQGKYEFSIELMPRYGGKYTMNPAKAEMMYFPVFYGREGIKKVEISNSR